MSNTIVTDYSNASGRPAAGDDPYVIIVNRDGSVALEREEIRSLTESRRENANVSIVRLRDDGKPDDASDHSSDDSIPHVNLTVDAFFDAVAGADGRDPHAEYAADLFGTEISLIAFRNDHCYTPLTSIGVGADERAAARRPPIPSSKKIRVIENKIIAKGKSVAYVGANGSREASGLAEARRRPADAERASVVSVAIREPSGIVRAIGGAETAVRLDADGSGPTSPPKRDAKRILGGKLELRNGLVGAPAPRPERNRILNFDNDKRAKTLVSRRVEDGSRPASSPSPSPRSDPTRPSDRPERGPVDAKGVRRPIAKRDRRQGARVAALLNDMTTLFSSPDVIRRISADSKPPRTPDAIAEDEIERRERVAEDPRGSERIAPSADPKSPPAARAGGRAENLDVMPFDEASLARLLRETNSGMLPADVAPESPGPIVARIPSASATGASVPLASPTSGTAGSNPPLSPGLDLLGGIHPEEEGLSEDLLRHVAQLVESSENLQEVIDKQVLGRVDDDPAKISPPPPLASVDRVEPRPPGPAPASVANKEPIRIVRSDGRVITLPPIEAPATRSSKRKSMMSATAEPDPVVSIPDAPKTAPAQTKRPINTYGRAQKVTDYIKSQAQAEKKDDDVESDESWNSEDDPDRLWCVCKQPHNNRFMICCDSCEDWFHGKCVNVTKAMGQEMEEKGIEWRCPNCVKKKGLANPSLKSLQLRKSTEGKNEERALNVSSNSIAADSSTNCIVCKKPARADSIFCSDACILKHAQESINIALPPSTAKTSRDVGVAGNKPKPETRVIVMERKSGRILSGQNAPTTNNLKTWLREHPTYEVVRPDANPNRPSNVSKIKPKPNSPKVQSVLTFGQDKQISFMSPPSKNLSTAVKTSVKPNTTQSTLNLKSPQTINKNQTVKTPLKSPSAPKTPTPQQKQTPSKSPSAIAHKKEDSQSRFNTGTDPIRENVRKTLREEISKRMSETQGVKFTQEDITKFSNDTEFELHDLFKDVGTKYKAKYRSLMFNLKDRKNLTLWQKICDRTITPKQLVRLSAEELASQELAQWRDKEVKHQLELIKKSELDLLSCNKTYVLKTHKGEEVMETQTMGTAELDPNVPVEDLVSVLNKTVDVGGNTGGNTSGQTSPTLNRDNRHTSHHKHSKHKSKSNKNSRSSRSDRSSSRHKSSSTKHKSSRDSRSDSRSHHRKSSRERDRKGSSSSTRRHSESSRHSTHSKSSKHNDNERKQSTDNRDSKDRDKKTDKEYFKLDLTTLENIRSPVLYETKEDEIGNELSSPSNESLKSPKTPDKRTIRGSTESDQEPTSTVESVVWNGAISMIDVAKFNVSAVEISGQSDDVVHELDNALEVVGRIKPLTVWEYISKMKKQGYNDILLLRFNTIEEEQYMALYNYLSTRDRLGVIRANSGIIKDFYILPLASKSTLPPILLTAYEPILDDIRPDLLVGIVIKQRRKRSTQVNPLSAIPSKIAKLTLPGDRSYTPPTESSYTPPSSPKRKLPMSSGILTSFLPNLSSTVKDKIAATLASGDDDEPYSPGGSDSGSLERSHSPGLKQSLIPSTSDDLQKKMEELNRRIAEEKKQIENMAVTISGDSSNEPYSPSRPMSPSATANTLPELSSISIPSNLQEILATIHKNSKVTSNEMTDSQSSTETYIPQPVVASPINSINSPYYKEGFSGDVDMRILNSASYPAMTSYSQRDPPTKSTGKLSTLSEAELLSMVPDNEVLLPPVKSSSPYLPHSSIPSSLTTDTSIPPPPFKRQKIDYGQPPPPGFD